MSLPENTPTPFSFSPVVNPILLSDIIKLAEFDGHVPGESTVMDRNTFLKFLTSLYGGGPTVSDGVNDRALIAATKTNSDLDKALTEYAAVRGLGVLKYKVHLQSEEKAVLTVIHPSWAFFAQIEIPAIYHHAVNLQYIELPEFLSPVDQYFANPDQWIDKEPAKFDSAAEIGLLAGTLRGLSLPIISIMDENHRLTEHDDFKKILDNWSWKGHHAYNASTQNGNSYILNPERVVGVWNADGKQIGALRTTVIEGEDKIKFIELLPIYCEGKMDGALNARQVFVDELAVLLNLSTNNTPASNGWRETEEKESKVVEENKPEESITINKLFDLNDAVALLRGIGLGGALHDEGAETAIKRLLVRSMNYAVKAGGHSTGLMEFNGISMASSVSEDGILNVHISTNNWEPVPTPIISFQAHQVTVDGPEGLPCFDVPHLEEDGEMMVPVYTTNPQIVKLTEALPFGSFWNMVRRNREAMKDVELMQTMLSEAGCVWAEMDLGVDLEIQTDGELYSDNRMVKVHTRYARYSFFIREQRQYNFGAQAIGFVRYHNGEPTDLTLDLAGMNVEGVVSAMAFAMVAIVKEANPGFVPHAETIAQVNNDLAVVEAEPSTEEVGDEIPEHKPAEDSSADKTEETLEEEPGTERLYTEVQAAQMACLEINAVFPTIDVLKGVFDMSIGWATSARMLKPRVAFFNYAEALAEASPAGSVFELKVKRSGKTCIVIDIHVLISGHVRATHHDFIDLAKVPASRSGSV